MQSAADASRLPLLIEPIGLGKDDVPRANADECIEMLVMFFDLFEVCFCELDTRQRAFLELLSQLQGRGCNKTGWGCHGVPTVGYQNTTTVDERARDDSRTNAHCDFSVSPSATNRINDGSLEGHLYLCAEREWSRGIVRPSLPVFNDTAYLPAYRVHSCKQFNYSTSSSDVGTWIWIKWPLLPEVARVKWVSDATFEGVHYLM